MGFMSGLAKGFSDSYQKGADRRAEMNKDLFQAAYNSYLNKKAQWDKDKKADQKAVDDAKTAVASAGVPEGAWTYAYQLIKGGDDLEQTIKRLQASTFATNNTPASVESANPAMDAIKQQTQDSGMAPKPDAATQQTMAEDGTPLPPNADPTQQPQDIGIPPTPQTPPTAQQAPQVTAQMPNNAQQADQTVQPEPLSVGNLFNPQQIAARRNQHIQQQLMGATGTDQATMDAINAGYTPNKLPDTGVRVTGYDPAKMTSSGGGGGDVKGSDLMAFKMKDGTVQWGIVRNGQTMDATGTQPIDRSNIASISDASVISQQNTQLGPIQDAADKISAKRLQAATLAQDLKYMDDIAQHDPTAIARVSVIPTFFNELSNEVGDIGSILAGGDASQIENVAGKAESFLSRQFQNAGMQAQDAQLLAARKVQVVFGLARLNNGGGSQLSNRDVDETAKQMLSTNDPAIFQKQAKDLVKRAMQTSDMETQQYSGNYQVQAAMKQQNIDPNSNFLPWDKLMGEDTYNWLNAESTGKPNDGSGIQSRGSDTSLATAQEHPVGATLANSLGHPEWADKMGKVVNGTLYVKGIDY